MCFGGKPKVDNTPQLRQQDAAAEARAREEARQARIETGRGHLDAMFDGGTFARPDTPAEAYNKNTGNTPGGSDWGVKAPTSFTNETYAGYDPYLAERRGTFLDFYQPQLNDQLGKAQDGLKYGLARSGQLASSQAAEKNADLNNDFDLRQSELLSRADADQSETRNRFETTRGALEDMLLSTGDASRVANRGGTLLNNLYAETPTVSPLGDMFVNSLSTYGQYGKGQTAGQVAGTFATPSITSQARYNGSGRVIYN